VTTAPSKLRTFGPWVAMAVIVVVALTIGVTGTSGPTTNEGRMLAIASTLKCEVCAGESVAQSDSGFAQQARVDIAKRLDEGQSAEQIRSFYISTDGANVSLIPASTGISSLVWIIPVIALIVSGAILVMVFRRWRIRGDVHATDADRELVAAALAAGPAMGERSAGPAMGERSAGAARGEESAAPVVDDDSGEGSGR
jgi:cytochrome c-type biogenesis protein CcmH